MTKKDLEATKKYLNCSLNKFGFIQDLKRVKQTQLAVICPEKNFCLAINKISMSSFNYSLSDQTYRQMHTLI